MTYVATEEERQILRDIGLVDAHIDALSAEGEAEVEAVIARFLADVQTEREQNAELKDLLAEVRAEDEAGTLKTYTIEEVMAEARAVIG